MVRLAQEQRDFTSSSKTGPSSRRFYVGINDHRLAVDVEGKAGEYSATVYTENDSTKTPLAKRTLATDWIPGQRVARAELTDNGARSIENFQVLESSARGVDIIFKGSLVCPCIHGNMT